MGREHRFTGIAVTALVHAALIMAWQMARTLPPPFAGADAAIQWLRLPAPVPLLVPPADTALPPPVASTLPRALRPSAIAPTPAAAPDPASTDALPAAPEPAATPTAASIMDSARRSVGDIDRALRKERMPTIVLPPDSPQIRLERGIGHAHDMAPPRLWEAPKVVELVNNTGDGARRTRVITGNGTYCITERSPVTSIDMIEKHGKQRFTSCPSDEEPAKAQAWRSARD